MSPKGGTAEVKHLWRWLIATVMICLVCVGCSNRPGEMCREVDEGLTSVVALAVLVARDSGMYPDAYCVSNVSYRRITEDWLVEFTRNPDVEEVRFNGFSVYIRPERHGYKAIGRHQFGDHFQPLEAADYRPVRLRPYPDDIDVTILM